MKYEKPNSRGTELLVKNESQTSIDETNWEQIQSYDDENFIIINCLLCSYGKKWETNTNMNIHTRPPSKKYGKNSEKNQLYKTKIKSQKEKYKQYKSQ